MIRKNYFISLTNQCNYLCSSCQIGCSPYNNSFLPFSVFQRILCLDTSSPLILHFDGGEPLLHPHFYLFLEYLATVENFKTLYIHTNGNLVEEEKDTLTKLISRLGLDIKFIVPITTDILEKHPTHLSLCQNLLEDFDVMFEVRYTNEEDMYFLKNLLRMKEFPEEKVYFTSMKAYGVLKDSEYPLYFLDDTYFCFASDGKPFGNDYTKRAEYELELSKNKVPVFDSFHHRNLWLESQKFFADISFEIQDNIKGSLEDLQRDYIETHLNIYTKDMLEKKFLSYAEYYSYVFQDGKEHNPFDNPDVFGRKLREEIFLLSNLMEVTTSVERFYGYKNLAIELCHKLAHLPILDDVKTTEMQSSCFFFKKGWK